MISMMERSLAAQDSQGKRHDELFNVVVGKPNAIHKGLVSRMSHNEAEVGYVNKKMNQMQEQRTWYSRKVFGTLIVAALGSLVAAVATVMRPR